MFELDSDLPFASSTAEDSSPRIDSEVIEWPLLLPLWQAQALEALASDRGLTAGQMLRSAIADLILADRPASRVRPR